MAEIKTANGTVVGLIIKPTPAPKQETAVSEEKPHRGRKPKEQ